MGRTMCMVLRRPITCTWVIALAWHLKPHQRLISDLCCYYGLSPRHTHLQDMLLTITAAWCSNCVQIVCQQCKVGLDRHSKEYDELPTCTLITVLGI